MVSEIGLMKQGGRPSMAQPGRQSSDMRMFLQSYRQKVKECEIYIEGIDDGLTSLMDAPVKLLAFL